MRRLSSALALALLLALLPAPLPARATYGYLLHWQAPAPLTQPIVVRATNARVTNDERTPPEAPDHGTIAILTDTRCWRVTLTSGDFRQEWSESEECEPSRSITWLPLITSP
jgi:hypothetical protein